MNMYEELKNKVELKAGIDHAAPYDCKKIVADIFKVTNKKISETTLKRFFGFAYAKYKFSKYTLAILKEYSESDCTFIINTKINPSKAKIKAGSQVKFDLEDGNLQSGDCMNKEYLDKIGKSAQKALQISIKLTKSQVKDLMKDIKKSGSAK